MSPTLINGDRVFVNTTVGTIERGDIIMFRYPDDETKIFLKRVIGLPGEKIEIRKGKVFINDVYLEETYVDPLLNQSDSNRPQMIIKNENYFVMGDNRDNSSDSRVWGTVDKNLILGKYVLTYY